MSKRRMQTTSFDLTFETFFVRHRETIRQSCFAVDQDERIPIAIQMFLWRQSNPFIKQKFGNLTDASAIVFDHVLVQNVLHGLSPSLTNAISSIPRWLLIKAAFPHVMHACSATIEHSLHSIHPPIPSTHPSLIITTSPSRSPSTLTQLHIPSTHQLPISHSPSNLSNQSIFRSSSSIINPPLNQSEIRLFHTLHYLLLYSDDNDDQSLSLNIVQLFIYLFLPYIHTYLRHNEKEFLANSDLAPGMRLIWQPLFEYHQPNIRIFNTFVKPTPSSNDQQHRLSILVESPVDKFTSDKSPLSDVTKVKRNKQLKSSTIVSTDSDPATTPDSTTDLEGYTITNQSKRRAPLVHMNSICSVSDSIRLAITPQSSAMDKVCIAPTLSISPSTSSTSCSPYLNPPAMPPLPKAQSSEYLLLATCFDIAIIRTLFSPSWLTDGYRWCLEYLHKRVVDIFDAHLSSHYLKSLSISQLNEKTYPTEQMSNQLVEKQCEMTTTLPSNKQRSILLNFSLNLSSRKNFERKTPDYFYQQKRRRKKIRYIDEDRLGHLDLANTDFDLPSSKISHLHLPDPTLLPFKPPIPSPLDRSNLPAMKLYSTSDSEIDYQHLEDMPECQGSSGYINRNGTINFSVILAGLHAVICKENHLKVCELTMNILDVLFGLNILSSIEVKKVNEQMEEIDRSENEKFQLSIDIILRILKRLGCKNCQPRGRSFQADQLRGIVRASLNKLRLINEKRFRRCFLNFATNGELIHILDILHPLCEYCSESSTGLAHYAPYILNKNETYSRQTYSNNFEDDPKTIDSFLLNLILKPLITRFNLLEDYLLAAENVLLHSECRAFLIYMKEHHGGIFRSAMFSALIDPEKKFKLIREKLLRKNDRAVRISLPNDPDQSISQHLHTVVEKEKPSVVSPTSASLPGDDEQSGDANLEEGLYVDLTLVRMGLLRMNFLLESCPPGSVPDPEFLNNLLFLDAPIISKAAFLIECAYFIRRCSLGQWPEGMRMNIASFRPHDTLVGRTNGNLPVQSHKIYQAAAGRMFYIWGEALSGQLESILDIEEHQSTSINDENFEDYYNEAIVNPSGHDCPYSLQLIVCLLLYEITAFLRETYDTLPKLSSFAFTGLSTRQQRMNKFQTITDSNPDKRSPDQLRMDSVASQTSNRSTLSLASERPTIVPSHTLSAAVINMNSFITERHISFAVPTDNDSNDSHHTIVVLNEEDGGDGNTATVPVSTSKSKLARRNSVRLHKPSLRLKDRNTHRLSFRTRRRSHASNFSIDTDGHQSNTMLDPTDEFDLINSRPFPWLRTIIRIFNNMNLTSDKQINSSKHLFRAVANMYQITSSPSCPSSTQTQVTPEKTQRFSMYLFGKQTAHLRPKDELNKHFQLISTYLEKQVKSLTQIPLMILCKSSVLLEEEHYCQILRLSWELLLDRNEELSSCAATIVILTAARASHLVDQLIHLEMSSSSALIRYNAILRFEALWRFRYQLWIRLEQSAHSMMKILPPSIEFVLPSPALGIANLQIVDPPWIPHAKTLVQQVALNQEEVRAVVTTSKTRKKHQQELIHSALMTEEISKQVARENFALSTVSILQAASFEPLLHQSRDDEEEAYAEDERAFETSVQLRQAHGTFPSAFGTGVFHLVEMLEDEELLDNGAIVSGTARQVLWTCLLDEPSLLIRFFFEKLSHKERRIKSLQSLRRLMIHLSDIPSQFAHAIFNYVLGILLSMVRAPLDGSQELIIAGLTLLWQIIPHLHGLVLKDFKQILRKEQAEMMILITGNIPSTKKVIIHGPDLSQIPTQAIIAEDTQFSNVLQEALEFFGIPDSKRDRYYLIDIKSHQVHIPDTYVRDFYFFRRNIYPQLSLVYLDSKQSQRQLEQISICVKTMELSKVLFARYLIESTPFNQIHNCITFFHDELLKSPLFPRKPLESDFNLYPKIVDKELCNLDMLHKYNWIKLITCIFFNMDGKTTTTWDITLFLPVINGAFILHCEDSVMLRFCLATYINIVKHFRHIFATNGYLLIMPTFLRVYSNIQSNPMLKKAIEFCCRQFFILHRIPFILQMLGSISQLLELDEQADVTDTNKIQPIAVFRLLIALEQTHIDAMWDEYSILELVKHDSTITKMTNTPMVAALGQGTMMVPSSIKSLDFCYADDETIFTLLNCFDVCVTVVAYAPDSIRSLQMLGIIDILLPKYFAYLKDRTHQNDVQKHGHEELKIIERLSIAMKTMINACESLTRTFVEPKCENIGGGTYKHSRSSYRSPSIAPDEDSMSRFMDDRTKSRAQDADERKQASEFRWPRDTLLSIIATFIHFSTQRLKDLGKLLNDPILRFPELLDAKCHTRLTDIAHTLLKLSSFDTLTISSHGIQSYFQKYLPAINWSQEQLRPTLNLLLRRTDRMFLKICKKPMIKRCFDWEATAGILNGIYLAIDRHPSIAYFPNLKTLISGSIALILNENVPETNHGVPRLDTPTFPKEFTRAVIKLVGGYLRAIKYQPNLEALTSNNCSSTNLNSTINHFLHFLLPLMFWAGSGRKDAPKLHPIDLSYMITVLLNSIKPVEKLASNTSTQNSSAGQNTTPAKQYLSVGEAPMTTNTNTPKPIRQAKDLLQSASFLGLKILIIAFNKQFKSEWQRIVQAIKFICTKQSDISLNLLSFIDFLVSYKTPIYLILRPFLLHYIHAVTSEDDCEIITEIQQKLSFQKIVPGKSIGKVLHELLQELNQLKAESTDEPKSSSPYTYHLFGPDKVRFDTEQMPDLESPASNTRVSTNRMTNTYQFRRQQQTGDDTSPVIPRNRTTKIQTKEALDILEPYYARSTARTKKIDEPSTVAITPKLLSPTYSHQSMSFLCSATVAGHRSFSSQHSMIENQSSTNDPTEPELRTFRGWKRNTTYLEKSRSSKTFSLSHISSEPSMTYDATQEMHTIFRPVSSIERKTNG